MISTKEALPSEAMDHIDVEFDDAVQAVLDRWGAVQTHPQDEPAQRELYRALRHAKLLYKGFSRQYGKKKKYTGQAQRLRMVVAQIGGGLFKGKNSSELSHSIQRQLREIREA